MRREPHPCRSEIGAFRCIDVLLQGRYCEEGGVLLFSRTPVTERSTALPASRTTRKEASIWPSVIVCSLKLVLNFFFSWPGPQACRRKVGSVTTLTLQSEQILRRLWRSKDRHPAQLFGRFFSDGLTKSELLKNAFLSSYSKPLYTLFFGTTLAFS